MRQKCPRCKGCATSRTIGHYRVVYCDFCEKYFDVAPNGYVEVPESEILERILEDARTNGKTENDIH